MEGIVKSDKIPSIFSIILFLLWRNVHLVNGDLRYQPELDQLSLEKYITDDYLFNMHINCLLYDGPCDPVGRWMRPRMASYFLSSCILCTPAQEKETDKFITWLYENHPQLFRTGISKYLDANGIKLPAKSKFREQMQNMNVPKVSISSVESGSQGSNNHTPKETLQDPQQPQNDDEGGPSTRVLTQTTPNARKNKFSSAISFSNGEDGGAQSRSENKYNPVMEDDEAEMDFKIYH